MNVRTVLITIALLISFSVSRSQDVSIAIAEAESSPGSIVFSDEMDDLDTGNINKDKLISEFSLMDNIYGRVLMGKPLKDYFEQYNILYDFEEAKYNYNFGFRILIDDDLKARWLYEIPEENFNRTTTFAFSLSGDEAHKISYSPLVNEWVEVVEPLNDGSHNVTIEMIPVTVEVIGEELPVIAKGDFTFHVDADRMEEFTEQRTTDLPAPTMVSPEIEQEIADASERIYDNAEPVRAVITDIKGDWSYSENMDGSVISRSIIASVIYYYPANDKCRVRTGLYSQKHQGNGLYAPAVFVREPVGYYDYLIPCEKVKEE